MLQSGQSRKYARDVVFVSPKARAEFWKQCIDGDGEFVCIPFDSTCASSKQENPIIPSSGISFEACNDLSVSAIFKGMFVKKCQFSLSVWKYHI